MRVADWIAEYLWDIEVFFIHGLMGGGAAGLNDGFIKHDGLTYVCYHHEQAAGHAAIGEAKYTGQLAVVNPTTGCGGTNCATSVLNAWQDGVPVLFLSGNVKLENTARWVNSRSNVRIRHYGAQEHDIVDTVRSITKYAAFVTTPQDVPYELKKAIHLATTGRPGPVWIDIPSDIQTAQLPEKYNDYHPSEYNEPFRHKDLFLEVLEQTSRPLVIAGMGIRQAGCVREFIQFVEKYQLPFVTTYGAQDYAPYDHPLNIGTPGVRGNRAGNFAMQNASFLLIMGTSLGAPVIGYDPSQFSPKSYKFYIDSDPSELGKNIIPIDTKMNVSIENFLRAMT